MRGLLKARMIGAGVLSGGKKAGPWYLAGGIDVAKCIIAYQPKGAADLATSYVNLANPGTNNATAPIAAPTFDAASGWIFNGVDQFLSTGFIPDTTKEYSMIIRMSNFVDPGGGAQTVYCGAEKSIGSRRWYLGSLPNEIGVLALKSSSVGSSGAGSKTSGVFASRILRVFYYNGAVVGTIAASPVGDLGENPFRNIWIGAVQSNGDENTPKKWSNFRVQAFALYGANSAITEAQIQAVTTAMAAL